MTAESPRDVFGQPFHRPGRRVDSASGARYYVDTDGTRLPSVTTLIDAGLPKPVLVRWAAKRCAEWTIENLAAVAELASNDPVAAVKAIKGAPWNTLERAGGEGTLIHAYAESVALGTELPEIPPHLKGKAEAFDAFLADFDPLIRGVELRVVNRFHGYAGTLDLICDIRGETGLLDVKTSSGIYPDHALQVSAYAHADHIVGANGEAVPMPAIDFCGIVHLRDDGYSLIPVDAGPTTFQAFLAVLRVAGWIDKADVIGDPITRPERTKE